MEFDEVGWMKLFVYFDCVVDVMEEFVKFMLLMWDVGFYLVDWYSEWKESVEVLL